MGYKEQKLLLVAAEEAFNENKLSKAAFLKIMDDIENDLIKTDKKLLSQDVNQILIRYANI